MSSRYANRIIFRNELPIYEKFIKERNVRFINHYNTPILFNPSVGQSARLNTIKHIWSTGDRYYKLASQYYSQPQYWWVIAQYNQAPTEAHLTLGDVVYIPLPLEKALLYLQG